MLSHFARRFASAVAAESTPTALSVLPNGLRVATQPHGHNGTLACVSVSLGSGTRNETRETSGTAHFLEHILFKGTKTRSQYQFEKEVENIGGVLNAYTSREVTNFSITVPKHKLPEGVAVLADMVLNPILSEAAIESERATIAQEADFVKKSYPDERTFDLLHSVAFENQSIGYDILGEDGNFLHVTKRNLEDYRAAHYLAPKMVISAAGAVSHEEVVSLASKHFSSLPSSSPSSSGVAGAVWNGGEVRVHNDDLPHVTGAVAFQGPGIAHPDSIALMVIQAMFGSWRADQAQSGNVANKFAQAALQEGVMDHSKVLSTDFFFIPYSDVSMVGFHFKAEPTGALEEITYNLMSEVIATCFVVQENDLARAKNALKTNFAQSIDGATRAADDVGKQLLYFGRRISPEEFSQRVDSITAADIKRVAGTYFYDRDVATCWIGPQLDHAPSPNWVRSWTYWLTA